MNELKKLHATLTEEIVNRTNSKDIMRSHGLRAADIQSHIIAGLEIALQHVNNLIKDNTIPMDNAVLEKAKLVAEKHGFYFYNDSDSITINEVKICRGTIAIGSMLDYYNESQTADCWDVFYCNASSWQKEKLISKKEDLTEALVDAITCLLSRNIKTDMNVY